MRAARIGLLLLCVAGVSLWVSCFPKPLLKLPKSSLEAHELALVVNDQDPSSVFLGYVYALVRRIPNENVIHVSIPPSALSAEGHSLTVTGFEAVIEAVAAQTAPSIQAYALAWTYPYQVNECMSITAAFAVAAYDEAYCNPQRPPVCNTNTKTSDYFGSSSVAPYTDFGIRPTMMLAGETVADAISTILKGLAADFTDPAGTVYLIRTTDATRSNPRLQSFESTDAYWDENTQGLAVDYIDNGVAGANPADNYLRNAQDILIYMTGLTNVADLETNHFLPGAIADHLTSYGGRLEGGAQMSALRWLEAGATASYGTVAEPCAVGSKFPNPSYLLAHYVWGNTAIEAYWKSVSRFGEGVFVGEPMARPFGATTYVAGGDFVIETTILRPGKTYELRGHDPASDTWTTVIGDISYVPMEPRRVLVAPAPLYPEYELVVVAE